MPPRILDGARSGALALVLALGCGSNGGADDAADAVPDAAPSSDASGDFAPESGSDATLDAASVDAAVDAEDGVAEGAAGDSAIDAGEDDAPSDAASEPAPPVCGDGVRAPDEECDLGVVVDSRSLCSSLCEVRDQVAVREAGDAASLRLRALGTGRHPLAVGPSGLALAWIEPQAPAQVGMTFYGPKGAPTGTVDRFGTGSVATTYSAPSVAALPNGKYAVVWSDTAGDGDGLGVVARVVDPSVASSGAPVRVNQTTTSGQLDADVVWSGSELVVAWTDLSVFPSDVRYRTFDSTLAPTSSEQTLAATSAGEGTVALAPFGASWAAAWREIAGSQETVRVKVGAASFATPAAAIGPYDYPPVLVELDATHLVLVYAEATGPSASKIRAALVDTAQPGVLSPFDIAPLAQGDSGAPPSAYRPAAVAIGARVFIAWTTEGKLADPKHDELWLKETSWNGSALDLSLEEIPLPRWDDHRLGDQRFPALAPSALAPGGALAVAWVDLGSTLVGSATTDVALSLFPVPLLRSPNADGGGL